MKPVQDYVAISKEEVEERLDNGLIINPLGGEETNMGTVVGVGPEIDYLEVGQKVIVSQYSGTRVEYKGENVFFLKGEDILAILD